MKNQIHNLEINNFKSIRHLELDCKRINVFIGEPNVGKSNILEALSMFNGNNADGFDTLPFSQVVRFERTTNLFYDQDRKLKVSAKTNLGCWNLQYHFNSPENYSFCIIPSKEIFIQRLDKLGEVNEISDFIKSISKQDSEQPISNFYTQISGNRAYDKFFNNSRNIHRTIIKPYKFKPLHDHKDNSSDFLKTPFGDNLYTILELNAEIYEQCTKLFEKYGLDLLIDAVEGKLEIQKRVGNRVYKIPYSLAADTLQRIIFHLAAIETNKNSILIFEEPEAHSFPPYISLFAESVIDSNENQFFIATHSPYILQPFIEQCNPDEIRIFVCKYENYETKARALSDDEIANILETGIDLFFNIPAFEK